MNATVFYNDGTAPLTYEIWVDKETARVYPAPFYKAGLMSFWGDLENAGKTGFFRVGYGLFIPVRRINEVRIEEDDTVHKISYRTHNQT